MPPTADQIYCAYMFQMCPGFASGCLIAQTIPSRISVWLLPTLCAVYFLLPLYAFPAEVGVWLVNAGMFVNVVGAIFGGFGFAQLVERLWDPF